MARLLWHGGDVCELVGDGKRASTSIFRTS
eukprot:COSAG02_NODE_33318_length_502_cov_0.712159_1_plen_29_part_10